MTGAFIGPWAWGIARDRTGNFQAGLLTLALTCVAAAALVAAHRRIIKLNAFVSNSTPAPLS